MTIGDVVLSFVHILQISTTGQLFALLVPRYTKSQKYLYRVIKELEMSGEIRQERNGRGKLIKVKGYQRRQVEHDLGVGDVVISLIRALWQLSYPFEQYFVQLDGWCPDAVLGFCKGGWRLIGIEYQRSPLTKRRWRNKFDKIKMAIERQKRQVYVLMVVEVGVFYSEHYIAELARLSDHPDFYFTSKELVDQTPMGELLTYPIWYHALEPGKVPIFDQE